MNSEALRTSPAAVNIFIANVKTADDSPSRLYVISDWRDPCEVPIRIITMDGDLHSTTLNWSSAVAAFRRRHEGISLGRLLQFALGFTPESLVKMRPELKRSYCPPDQESSGVVFTWRAPNFTMSIGGPYFEGSLELPCKAVDDSAITLSSVLSAAMVASFTAQQELASKDAQNAEILMEARSLSDKLMTQREEWLTEEREVLRDMVAREISKK